MDISQYLRIDRDGALPLTVQLVQQLRWLIVRGQTGVGDRLPPVRELADELGINMHTVRAAYQELSSAGLVTSRPGAGTTVAAYDPERLGTNVAGIPSFTIGVIVPSLEEFYTPMLEAIDDALEHGPTMVVVCNTREVPTKAAWFVDQLVARGTDGIILIAHDPYDPSGAPIPRVPANVPTVVVDWPTASDPVVVFDMHGAGHQAAAHLIEHGHERIGVITPPMAAPSVAETHAGIHQALSDASLTLQPDDFAHVSDFATPAGIDGAEQLLALDPPPTAILALGDQLAIGVIHAARSHGLAIPTDLALVSIGDIAVAPYLDPPLTTVHQDPAAAGTAATQALLHLINGEAPEATRLSLPTTLIIRRSCGCPAEPIPSQHQRHDT
ncbi:MAG: GntR family transcriptional regulator [Jiangellales bacterium]